MENNEIMINEEFDVMDDNIVADDGHGLSTGMAVLIGAGLGIALGAVVNLGKKGIDKIKANRAAKKAEVPAKPEESDQAEVEAK